jgi:tetratricopeptide (TPR) repeat protein
VSAVRREAAKRALERAQKLEPNSPETLLALGYYQYWVLRDYSLARTTFERVREMLPGSSEVPYALGAVARREGNWDESVAYFKQALALDPHNIELLSEAATTYVVLRQFPNALKLIDRALDVLPNDPGLMAFKAACYHTEGNLQEAAKLLVDVNAQTNAERAFRVKITQLRLERKYDEAIRLLQARLAQFHFVSEIERGSDQVILAVVQRLAGDDASAKATAELARETLQPHYKDQGDNPTFAALLSLSYAVLGNKELAVKEAERAIILLPSAKDAIKGPMFEENLALIQTIIGDNSRAISILTRLSQTPYISDFWDGLSTPARVRLDPFWDPLRGDPASKSSARKSSPSQSQKSPSDK